MARSTLPDDFSKKRDEIRSLVTPMDGWLTRREIDFLALLGACPTSEGVILEIGSFKGKSTVVLVKSADLADGAKVVACDPFTNPSAAYRAGAGCDDWYEAFRTNIERMGVSDRVDVRKMRSSELAQTWNGKIRLLWIDGDHSYQGAKQDVELFSPFLAPGAIVAMHDCLAGFDGPARVLIENIVLSPQFGPVGVCGNIGWGRYLGPSSADYADFDVRMRLYRGLSRLLPYQLDRRPTSFIRRKLFLASRLLVPHGAVNPRRWVTSLG